MPDPLAPALLDRVAPEFVSRELTRLAAALRATRARIEGVLEGLSAEVAAPAEAHLLDLRDIVFLADAEGLVLQEHFTAESALVKVVHDAEQLVGRTRAGRMRDLVGGLLRHMVGQLERSAAREVLVTPDLHSIDLLCGPSELPLAIALEVRDVGEQALTLAHGLGVPLLVGVEGLLDALSFGDEVELDADAGTLRVARS